MSGFAGKLRWRPPSLALPHEGGGNTFELVSFQSPLPLHGGGPGWGRRCRYDAAPPP